MGAAFQGQRDLAVPNVTMRQVQETNMLDEPGSPLLHEETSAQLRMDHLATQLQAPHRIDERVDLQAQGQHPVFHEDASIHGSAGRSPRHVQIQMPAPSDEFGLPMQVDPVDGEEALGRTWPDITSLEETRGLLLSLESSARRRRRRAQTVTITSSQMMDDALASDKLAELVLRPPRMILTTPEGLHSLCLPQDCEARMHYVQAGLPAGPPLPEKETCAICLEEFQTAERVQLMASCRHVFHAACIKTLLQSRTPAMITDSFNIPCPLCRGPLAAGSMCQIPRRERRRAITLHSAWLASEVSTSETNIEDEDSPNQSEAAASTKRVGCGCNNQFGSASLRRAGTAPLAGSDSASLVLPQRAASSHLEALSGAHETSN